MLFLSICSWGDRKMLGVRLACATVIRVASDKTGEEAVEYRKLFRFDEIGKVLGDSTRVYGGRSSKCLLARRRHRYRHNASIVVRSNALDQSRLDQSIDDARHTAGGDQDELGQITHSDGVSGSFVQTE